MRSCDAVVIGGGIAGMSAAYSLARRGVEVVVLEREDSLTAHSTGRSAAQYIETYGGPVNQALTVASRDFLLSNADGLAEVELLQPRAVLWVAPAEHLGDLEQLRQEMSPLTPHLAIVGPDEARTHCPVLSPQWVAGGLFEEGSYDIDVAGLHQAFLRGARRHGTTVVRSSPVEELDRASGRWELRAAAGAFAAPVVVNAAGAWADDVAGRAGVPPLGLAPLRRTIFTFAAPAAYAAEEVWRWPLVADIGGRFYFKPEGPSQILGSPADETPDAPCDARAEELDVARGIDAVNGATTLGVRAVRSVWAGLRTFAADRHPVAGFDEGTEGFVWCAGQGGTGIQTSPAMGEAVASIVCGTVPPAALSAVIGQLSPGRLRHTG
ncbi:MAG: FAD-binding oxidoreductase [bacterium]|nr:FAD-binding oxidoreductase [bacterium]